MKTICVNKKTGKKWETTAERVNNKWMIGGDYPDYKNIHYIVYSKDVEYTLKNGRLIQS